MRGLFDFFRNSRSNESLMKIIPATNPKERKTQMTSFILLFPAFVPVISDRNVPIICHAWRKIPLVTIGSIGAALLPLIVPVMTRLPLLPGLDFVTHLRCLSVCPKQFPSQHQTCKIDTVSFFGLLCLDTPDHETDECNPEYDEENPHAFRA